MARCKTCQAEIRWALTAAGAKMPLDPEPSPDGNILLGLVGGEEVAIVLSGAERAGAQEAQRPLYVTHFYTCPDANEHRKR